MSNAERALRWVVGGGSQTPVGQPFLPRIDRVGSLTSHASLGGSVAEKVGSPTASSDAVLEALTEARLPWYAEAGVLGMRLVVQRAKRIARGACDGARFGAPITQQVCDEDGQRTVVVLRVYLPADADDFAFRDDYFTELDREMRSEDLERLAVRVLTRGAGEA